MSGDGRERLLRAIAERIAPDDIVEVHVFPPIRQGGRETGVAVVTARHPDGGAAAFPSSDAEMDADAGAPVAAGSGAAEAASAPPEESAGASHDVEAADGASDAELARVVEELVEREPVPAPDAPPPVERLTVYRAHYRLTIKGPDRGKWEVGITEEADAPSRTVDAVVRGVHERAGGDDEPERLTGEALRAALTEEPWTATR